jgi:thioredoxin reductase (NADPH)
MQKLILILLSFLFPLCAQEQYAAVVLGGGVAGLTSATYLARAGLKTLVIVGPTPGGVITSSPTVQNWPGELQISGADLADKLQKQAQANGAILDLSSVKSVDFSTRPFMITTQNKTVRAEACIVALGAQPKLLDVPGEKTYYTRGVSTCTLCDGSLYKGKTVAVVGGGDSALTSAQYLANIAHQVFVIVRKDQFRTVEEKRKTTILKTPNIAILYNTTITAIEGDGQKLTSLLLSTGEHLKTDALFLAIGSEPNTALFQGQLELNAKGYIVLKDQQATSVEGVFAAGEAADSSFAQASTAAGDGAKAAIQAERSLMVQSSSLRTVQSLQQLEHEVTSSPGETFVYFTSLRCPPCKIFGPIFEVWAQKYADKIRFLKVDVEHAPAVAYAFDLRGVPTLLVLNKERQVVRRCVGLAEIQTIDPSTR